MASAIEAPASTTAEGPTSHTQNQTGGLLKLRTPFPAEQIQHLPKIWCQACSKSRTKVCENPQHQKAKCRNCGNYITAAHVDLDYVGHAELTNRLLDADPLWDWEPVAIGADGLPQFDQNGGLWIRLTVCGHSRLGYGDSQGKNGPNAVKEAIGDALRNAAMRFGAALDLWAKSDLREAAAEHPKSAEDDTQRSAAPVLPQASVLGEASQVAQALDTAQAVGGHLDRLMDQIRRCWDNALALVQVKGDADKHQQLDKHVQGPDEAWVPMRKLLDDRIAELNEMARRSKTEGSAA